MEMKGIRPPLLNGIMISILWYLFPHCVFSLPITSITFMSKPVTVYSIPIQKTNANINFKLNLLPFISQIRPEIDYQVTNNATVQRTLKLSALPGGFSRVYDGEHVCQEPIILSAHQSCLLRFYVDKTHYKSSSKWPMICDSGGLNCSGSDPNMPLNQIVARIPTSIHISATPASLDGLDYDPQTFSIVGKPTRTGTYHFMISVAQDNNIVASQDLEINVNVNSVDKPVFKKYYTIMSAIPEQNYRLDLLSLIETNLSFGVTNQVHFRIDPNHTHRYPSWISLDQGSATLLHGHVPLLDAGQIKELTIIASSNTGGDSEPLTIRIPVAYDPSKKPVFNDGIALNSVVGAVFQSDLRANIWDPVSDGSLKMILDKVEPAAPWLLVSSSNPTQLIGVVPEGVFGQTYQLTLYANTTTGGPSEPVTVALHIDIDKQLTPQFYLAKPQLPLLYAGQPYRYDFVSHDDIAPQYRDIPYQVEFAEGYNNPSWVRIDNNQLIVDKVPDDLEEEQTTVFITLRNTPGGRSEVVPLVLLIMR